MSRFNELEKRHGLPSGLLNAVMQVESRGNVNAVSPRGARGAFQFMPATAKQYGVNTSDMGSSADGAARMYADLLKQSGGDLPKALAGYNWGQGNVSRKGMDNMPAETRQYISKVTANMQPKIDKSKIVWDEPQIDTASIVWDAATAQAEMPLSARPTTLGMDDGKLRAVGQGIGNTVAGAVRGAGSIGATILAPYDMAKDAFAGKGLSLESNRQRRADIDGGLQAMGAQPDSMLYKGAKVGGEIAGTLGAGPLIAGGTRMMGAAPSVVNAISSAGMTTGAQRLPGALGLARNMLPRMAGGGITGGAMAGMVDPSNAGSGASIGALLPPALSAGGYAANAIGNLVRGPAASQAVTDGIKSARQARLVIPPTQAKPSLFNRALEGTAGKLTTAQNASAKNAPIIDDLVASELGIAKGTQVTPEMLTTIRKTASKAYEAVRGAGTITPGPAYAQALDNITAPARQAAQGFPGAKANPLIAEIDGLRSTQFDASSAVSKISELRGAADAAYRGGDNALGKGLKSAASALEDAIEAHLKQSGAPGAMLSGFRESRKLIAKTHSAEKVMNPTTGNFDAVKLAAQLAKKKPMEGGMRTAAEFAQQFPKAAQQVSKMGSLPGFSPLDLFATAGLGVGAGLTGNPYLMGAAALRPGVRALALSPLVQNRLANTGANRLGSLLSSPAANQLLYRAAPQAANR